MTPFEFMVGTNMKLKSDVHLRALIDEELIEIFREGHSELRDEAVRNIVKI